MFIAENGGGAGVRLRKVGTRPEGLMRASVPFIVAKCRSPPRIGKSG